MMEIPLTKPWIDEDELVKVTNAVSSGWISPRGEYVREFESEFAEFVGTDYAFATTTGTAAMHLSLVAAGVGNGDEVIVPDLTWIACANVVQYVGATPVFVDVDPKTYTLDPGRVQEALSPNTAALMPVHLYGQPCDMDPLLDISETRGIFVLEDSAEAHGATYRGNRVGSIGDVGCFSFYGNKIMTTGQGGMITTDDKELAARIQLLRRDGMSPERKYFHPVIGYNYRLTNLQAAIGVAQLNRVNEILEEKRRISTVYKKELDDFPLNFQTEPDFGTSAHWMTAPVFDSAADRKSVEMLLEERGIETRPFFHPLHLQPPYDKGNERKMVSMSLAKRGLNVPSGPQLEDADIELICRNIRRAIE